MVDVNITLVLNLLLAMYTRGPYEVTVSGASVTCHWCYAFDDQEHAPDCVWRQMQQLAARLKW